MEAAAEPAVAEGGAAGTEPGAAEAAEPGAEAAEPGAEAAESEAAERAVLDAKTFDHVLEPRSENRLPLGDGTWHQLARAYVWVRLISLTALFVVVLAAAAIITALSGETWLWIPAGLVALGAAWTAAITPRQARSFGYQLRADDLVFRRGILWQRTVAVPYGRMQLVDITHGPLDRAFGIAQLKLVTAAASTGVSIPGLTQEAAESLRDTLVTVAESRRTGL